MRQAQHKNNRQRNRGRGGRSGGGNSSNRVYDSNGPDVKVRGSAQHVADKYLQLGRDAQSAGDTVTAESYFQHAEHYLRIIAANQPQQTQSTPQAAPQAVQNNKNDDAEDKATSKANTQDTKTNDEVPGSGEQPAVVELKKADKDENWSGPQPAFLRKPVTDKTADKAEGDEKPKPKRTRTRKPKVEQVKADEAESNESLPDKGEVIAS